MKRLFLTLITVLITASAWAQSPFQFNFQAVARNLAGNPLTNQSVDFRLSVLQGAMDGTAVYVEEQSATTNNFGLANLLVGSGMPSLGSLSAVDWANGPYFLQIELDIQNGEGYQLMGTSALASVPYALHAKTSEQAGPEGPQGEPGEQGQQGPAGEQGEAGAGVAQVEIINDSLWLTLTTGEIQNAGRVVPALDSLMGSAGATGNSCDPRFPLGRSGETIFYNAGYGDYTVPAGMCLVVNHVYGSEAFFFINGKKLLYGDYNYEDGDQSRFTSSIIAGEGDIIGSPNSNLNFSGLLAPMSANVVPVTESLNTADYTVPEGMLFVWLQSTGTIKVNGVFILKTDVHSSMGQPLILNAGDVISRVPGATAPEDGTINGYLVEEGFFDGCDSAATSAGADGQSAYELWLSLGNEGTEEDFLASLVGPQGEPGSGGSSGFTHFLGEAFGGGIVFHLWLDPTTGEEHGLVVCPDYFSGDWGYYGVQVNALSRTNGMSNLDSVRVIGVEPNSIWSVVDTLTYGGYSDWYIPAKHEAQMLANNALYVQNSLDLLGYPPFQSSQDSYYRQGGVRMWTSTAKPSSTNSAAWVWDPNDGFRGSSHTAASNFYWGFRDDSHSIFPIRRF